MQKTRRSFLKKTAAIAAAATTVRVSGSGFPFNTATTPILNASKAIERHGSPRIKVSCCAYSLRKYLSGKNKSMNMDDFLLWASETKLDAVELTSYYFPPNVTPDYLHKIKRHAFLLGLDVSGTAVGNTFCLPPGPKRKQQIAKVKTWVDNAVHLGAPCMRVFGGGIPKGASEDQAVSWVAECIEESCEYAGKNGVFLALENHGGITATADRVLKIIKKVKSPWFGINLDSGNFRTEDPYSDIEKVAPYAITAHIKVFIHPKGGKEQKSDYRRVFKIFRKAGYRGYVSLEYEGRNEPKSDSAEQIALLKQLSLQNL